MTGRNHTLQAGRHWSKYTFTETPDGFVVRGDNGVPVRVRLQPTHFSVSAADSGPFYGRRNSRRRKQTRKGGRVL